MTAYAASVDRDRCLAAGMDVYLTKPIAVERLREVLSNIAPHMPLKDEKIAELQM